MAAAGDVAPGSTVAFVVAGLCLQIFSRVAWIAQMPERWFHGLRTMARFEGLADGFFVRVGISGPSPAKGRLGSRKGLERGP